MKNIIMAAELGLLSFTQLQKLAQQQQQQIQANFQEASAAVRSSSSISNNNNSINSNNYNWMWNPKHHQENQEEEEEEEEDEDSWEVKAFEQDTTGNNTVTWPPRSYTCTFCRREFRSAQALGGHMNVHRRDRARLHQTLPTPTPAPAAVSSTSSATTLLIPAQEFGGGLCVLYSLPNPNGVNTSCMDSPSTTTVLSISPFEANNLVAPLFPNTTTTYPNSSASNIISNNIIDNGEIKMEDSSTNEELDLELRLGRR